MKKMVAILVALMLLALPFASAESVFYFADPTLKMNAGGENMSFDLTGMELCVAANQVGENVVAKLFVTGGGETLFAIDLNVAGYTVLLTATGLSSVLSFTVPEEALQSVMSASSGAGIQIPDEVMEKVTNIITQSIQMDEQNGTIRIPYTAVNDVLTEILPYVDLSSIPNANADEIIAKIEELKQANSGVDLVGSFSSEDNGNFALEFSAYPVQDGTAAETAVINVSTASADGNFTLLVDVGGQGSLNISLIDGLLTVALNAPGTQFELTGKPGSRDADVELVQLDGSNAIDITQLSEEDTTKLGQELMMGASGLINYLYSALGAAS